MPSCDDFEIALERRAHGDALEPDLAAALDAHLPGCARCTAYAATVALATTGLASIAEAARAGVDWDAMERSIRERQGERRKAVLRAAAIGGAIIAVALAGIPEQAGHALLILAVTVPVVLVRVAWVFRETRRLAAITAREELFAAERAHVARRLGTLRRMRWVAVAVVLGLLVTAWWSPSPTARLSYIAQAVLIAAIWIHAQLVAIPKLARMAAELEDVP